MISFVIPTYNCIWLPQAVQSVMEQTEKDWELVIMDDGSTDSTKQYLKWLKAQGDNRIVIRQIGRSGRSVTRNLGNVLAHGSHIFVLDADDMAMPRRIEWTMEKFKDGIDFVYGSSLYMDALGNKTGEHKADVFDLTKAREEKVNRIVHSSVAYTKEFAMKYPYRDGEISKLGIDDWEQQYRSALYGANFDFTTKEICAYRELKNNTTNTRDQKKVDAFKRGHIEYLEVPA